MTPNPNCPECRGTGFITLFTSRKPCGCSVPLSEKVNDNCWVGECLTGEPTGFTVTITNLTVSDEVQS